MSRRGVRARRSRRAHALETLRATTRGTRDRSRAPPGRPDVSAVRHVRSWRGRRGDFDRGSDDADSAPRLSAGTTLVTYPHATVSRTLLGARDAIRARVMARCAAPLGGPDLESACGLAKPEPGGRA